MQAPEILEGGRATPASDVYSFGMVLFELLAWRLPWTFAEMSPFKVRCWLVCRIGLTCRLGLPCLQAANPLPSHSHSASCEQVGATIRQGGRPEVPRREALPGPDTAGWAGLDAYVCLMR